MIINKVSQTFAFHCIYIYMVHGGQDEGSIRAIGAAERCTSKDSLEETHQRDKGQENKPAGLHRTIQGPTYPSPRLETAWKSIWETDATHNSNVQ